MGCVQYFKSAPWLRVSMRVVTSNAVAGAQASVDPKLRDVLLITAGRQRDGRKGRTTFSGPPAVQ